MLTAPLWDPWSDLESLRGELDRLVSRAAAAARPGGGRYRPRMSLQESQGEYVLHADLPGVSQDSLDIELTGRQLRVAGERRRPREDPPVRYERTLVLPEEAELDGVSAELVDGVLCLRVPKRERARPRRVEIAGGEMPVIEAGPSTEAREPAGTPA